MRRFSLPLAASASTVSALRVSALRVAALTVSALALTACPDDPAKPDTDPPADASPDGASPARCDEPSPARGHCDEDGDCPADHVCRVDPNQCFPSFCECLDGEWSCTADCSLGPVCVPVPEPCGDDACAIDERCVEGRCLTAGEPCARDFDCPDGYCHPDHRVCFRPCLGEPRRGAAPRDSLPPLCGIGEALVWQDGDRCVDARTCEAPPPDPCRGAFIDDTGACRAPDDGELAAECCTLAVWPFQWGVIEHACAPDGDPAVVLRFGLGTLECRDTSESTLHVTFWADPVPNGEILDVTRDGFPGRVDRCDADGCEAPEAGALSLDFAPSLIEEPSITTGRFWFAFPSGHTAGSRFVATDCGTPRPMCQ